MFVLREEGGEGGAEGAESGHYWVFFVHTSTKNSFFSMKYETPLLIREPPNTHILLNRFFSD